MISGVLAISAFLPACGCTYIEPGHVGVLIKRTGGGVKPEPLPAGYQTYTPVAETIVEYPVFMQTVVYAKAPTEGSPNNEEMNVNSVEGQPISYDVSLSFELEPSKVPALYEKFRQPIEVVTHSFVKNAIRQALQEVVGNRHVADALGKDKASIVTDAKENLEKHLKMYGFMVQQFTINEVRAPQQITQAIQNKIAMEQEALRAQNENVKKKFEGEQQVIAAEAEAKSILAKAEAQAKANELISRSLSATLVNYMAIQKWNGSLPQFSGGGGGSVPLINFGSPPPAQQAQVAAK